MKDALENIFTITKILIGLGTIFVGIQGFIFAQGKLKEATVSPSLEQKFVNVNSQWFHGYKQESCSTSALWEIKNIGKHNIEVKDIQYSVYTFPDEPGAEKGQYKDVSWGNIIKNKKPIIGPIELSPKSSLLAPGEKISRDILYNYYPNVDNPESWFDKRRFAIKVDTSATIKSYGEWCWFCTPKVNDAYLFSRNKYYCRAKSNNGN